MTATLDSNWTDNRLRSALLLDFTLVSVEFAKARLQQSSKDTPAHRVAVAAARDRVDVVLDMYLATRPPGCSTGADD
jgi:hypothetical protein